MLSPDVSLKMLRESLCVAQTALQCWPISDERTRHLKNLQKLIDEIDRHRPLGPDGKHDNRHTPTCGCEDKQMTLDQAMALIQERYGKALEKLKDM